MAKKPIIIPEGVSVDIDGWIVKVSGPKGNLERKFSSDFVMFETENGTVALKPRKNAPSGSVKITSGTFSSHIKNMIKGVLEGFEKKLEIEGVGYRAEVQNEDLVLNMGFSHPVVIKPRDGVSFSVEKNVITVSGIDKEKVGDMAAIIRSVRKPEPYKGKGIRYAGEIIRRKAGKKIATAA